MTAVGALYNGQDYPVAPMEPLRVDKPSDSAPMVITPTVAKVWLRYNYRNRNERITSKQGFSADMATGGFALNGETIIFSRPLGEGEDELVPAGHPVLLDGQHRLLACILADKPFATYVVFGIDPGVRATIDVGAARNFTDVLALQGHTLPHVLSAVVKRVHAYRNGDTQLTMKKVSATHALLLDYLEAHPALQRDAEIAFRTRTDFERSTSLSLRQGVVGLAHHLFMEADESLAPEFFARLGDGSELKTHNPVYLLRARLIRDQRDRKQARTQRDAAPVPDWQQLAYFIRTWNAYLLWIVTPEAQRETEKPFVMVGPKDRDRVPDIRTMDNIYQLAEARAKANERDRSKSSGKKEIA